MRSEWVLNRVRGVVLLLLTGASALYALEAENRAEGGARFVMGFPIAHPREERLSA